VLVPAVMVSTAMQGGCTCENASLLRIGTGNVEFAALIAPRPLCLISANDWTHEMAAKGFPQLASHYKLLGAADRIEHVPLLQFGHNYNYASRAAMYDFVNRHLDVEAAEPIVETEFTRLTSAELSVWDEAHPRPTGGPEFERQLLKYWADDARQQIEAHRPHDRQSAQAYRQLVGRAWQAILRRDVPDAGRVEWTAHANQPGDGYVALTGSLHHRLDATDPGAPAAVEVVPVAGLLPDGWNRGPVAIWLDVDGKSGLLVDGQPRPEVRRLLDRQVAVIGVDLLEQGEHRSGDGPLAETRRVQNSREAAAYTLGYNDSLFAQRVHDVLTVISFVTHSDQSPSEVWLIGLNGAGPWAAAARAQAAQSVTRAAIDTKGFRFLHIDSVRHEHLLPGGAKYDDLPGLLAVAAPGRLWLAGESASTAPLVPAAYAAAGAAQALQWGETNSAAIDWLLTR
jgi:hypothetical protein